MLKGIKIEKYISSKLLNEVILDIEALQTGNYDIKDDWFIYDNI